jgi:hypothetical protein
MERRECKATGHPQFVGDGIGAVNDGFWRMQNDGAFLGFSTAPGPIGIG